MEYMFMPLKRYAEFSGRSRRMEFWMWKLFTALVAIAFWIVMIAMVGGAAFSAGGDDMEALAATGGGMLIVSVLYGLFGLAIFIPDLAVTVRRLHDTDRSGWWILAPLAPYLLMFVGAIGGAASGAGGDGAVAALGLFAILCMLAVFVLGIMLIVFLFLDGTRGPNRFGPDPKGGNMTETFA